MRQLILNYSFKCFVSKSTKTGEDALSTVRFTNIYKIVCIGLEADSVAGTVRRWWKM